MLPSIECSLMITNITALHIQINIHGDWTLKTLKSFFFCGGGLVLYFKKTFISVQYHNSCAIGFSFSQSAPKETTPKESTF